MNEERDHAQWSSNHLLHLRWFGIHSQSPRDLRPRSEFLCNQQAQHSFAAPTAIYLFLQMKRILLSPPSNTFPAGLRIGKFPRSALQRFTSTVWNDSIQCFVA